MALPQPGYPNETPDTTFSRKTPIVGSPFPPNGGPFKASSPQWDLLGRYHLQYAQTLHTGKLRRPRTHDLANGSDLRLSTPQLCLPTGPLTALIPAGPEGPNRLHAMRHPTYPLDTNLGSTPGTLSLGNVGRGMPPSHRVGQRLSQPILPRLW